MKLLVSLMYDKVAVVLCPIVEFSAFNVSIPLSMLLHFSGLVCQNACWSAIVSSSCLCIVTFMLSVCGHLCWQVQIFVCVCVFVLARITSLVCMFGMIQVCVS